MTALFLAAVAAGLALRLWLVARQARCVRAHRDAVPEPFSGRVSLEAHRKAADYTVARIRLDRLERIARTGLLLAWTLGGGFDLLDSVWPARPLWAGVGLILSASALTEVSLLPFAAWRVFVVEERFGFNRTTVPRFFADLARGALVGLVLGGLVVLGALWLLERGGRLWWLWAWAGWVLFSLILLWIGPRVIAPLFNRFTPLPEGELRERVRGLLERTGFRDRGLFVMDGSRRSTHATAYLAGLGRNKRIVLFDTLLALLAPAEVEAVLAHELGHFRGGHLLRRLAWGAAAALAALLALDLVLDQEWFFSGLGVSAPSPRTGLLLLLWVAPVFLFPLRPLLSALSRRQEYAADGFAARHSDGAALVRALVKIYDENASTLTPDPIHSVFYDSHPPAAPRIARLKGMG